MKNKILGLLVFIAASSLNAQQWHSLGFDDQTIKTVAIHPENPEIIYCAGTGLYKSIDGGANWDTLHPYPGISQILFHPTAPDTVYFVMGCGSDSDGVFKSSDNGETWDIVAWVSDASCMTIPAMHPEIMLVGSKYYGVYYSDDYGQTFTALNDSLDNIATLCMTTTYPASIPEDPMLNYILGTYGGFYTFPDHLLFDPVDEYWHHTNTATNCAARSVSVSEYGSRVFSAISCGSYSDGIYYSDDQGTLWQACDYFLYTTSVLMNPVNPLIVYSGALHGGVKKSIDEGVNWTGMNENLGDSSIYCLGMSRADTSKLYAGTELGLWVYGNPSKEEDLSKETGFIVYPNPFSDMLFIETGPGFKEGIIEIFDSSGKIIYHSTFVNPGRISLNPDMPAGIYLIKLSGKNYISCQRIIK